MTPPTHPSLTAAGSSPNRTVDDDKEQPTEATTTSRNVHDVVCNLTSTLEDAEQATVSDSDQSPVFDSRAGRTSTCIGPMNNSFQDRDDVILSSQALHLELVHDSSQMEEVDNGVSAIDDETVDMEFAMARDEEIESEQIINDTHVAGNVKFEENTCSEIKSNEINDCNKHGNNETVERIKEHHESVERKENWKEVCRDIKQIERNSNKAECKETCVNDLDNMDQNSDTDVETEIKAELADICAANDISNEQLEAECEMVKEVQCGEQDFELHRASENEAICDSTECTPSACSPSEKQDVEKSAGSSDNNDQKELNKEHNPVEEGSSSSSLLKQGYESESDLDCEDKSGFLVKLDGNDCDVMESRHERIVCESPTQLDLLETEDVLTSCGGTDDFQSDENCTTDIQNDDDTILNSQALHLHFCESLDSSNDEHNVTVIDMSKKSEKSSEGEMCGMSLNNGDQVLDDGDPNMDTIDARSPQCVEKYGAHETQNSAELNVSSEKCYSQIIEMCEQIDADFVTHNSTGDVMQTVTEDSCEGKSTMSCEELKYSTHKDNTNFDSPKCEDIEAQVKSNNHIDEHVDSFEQFDEHVENCEQSDEHVENCEQSDDHVERYEQSDEHVESREQSAEHVESCEQSDEHVESCEQSVEQVESCELSDEHVESCEQSDEHVESCEQSAEHVESCKQSDEHVESCEQSAEHVKSCKQSDEHVETCELFDEHMESCEHSDEHVESCEQSDEYVETCELSAEHVESCEQSDEHLENCELSADHVERYEQSDEHMDTCEQSGEHVESCEQSDEHMEIYEQSGEHVGNCEQSDEHVESCDQSIEHMESCEQSAEYVETNEQSNEYVENCEQSDEHVESCKQSDEQSAEHVESCEQSDEHVENCELSAEHVARYEQSEEHVESCELFDEHVESCELSDEHMESSEQSDQHVESCEQSDEHVESCKQSTEHVKSCELSDEHVESCEQSDEHVESCEQSDEHVESCKQSDEHVESCEQSDEHVESCEQSDEHVESCEQSDEHVESCEQFAEHVESCEQSAEYVETSEQSNEYVENSDKSDKHVESYKQSDECVENCEQSDKHVESCERLDEHLESCEQSDKHVESCERLDEHLESCEQSEEDVGSCEQSDEHVESCKQSDEHIETCELFDEHVESCEQSDQLVETSEQSYEHVRNCEQSDEHVESCEQSDEHVESYEQSDEHVETCEQSEEYVENCEQSDEHVESCELLDEHLESCEQSEEDVESCEQSEEHVETCEQSEDHVDNCELSDKHVDVKHIGEDYNNREIEQSKEHVGEQCDDSVDSLVRIQGSELPGTHMETSESNGEDMEKCVQTDEHCDSNCEQDSPVDGKHCQDTEYDDNPDEHVVIMENREGCQNESEVQSSQFELQHRKFCEPTEELDTDVEDSTPLVEHVVAHVDNFVMNDRVEETKYSTKKDEQSTCDANVDEDVKCDNENINDSISELPDADERIKCGVESDGNGCSMLLQNEDTLNETFVDEPPIFDDYETDNDGDTSSSDQLFLHLSQSSESDSQRVATDVESQLGDTIIDVDAATNNSPVEVDEVDFVGSSKIGSDAETERSNIADGSQDDGVVIIGSETMDNDIDDEKSQCLLTCNAVAMDASKTVKPQETKMKDVHQKFDRGGNVSLLERKRTFTDGPAPLTKRCKLELREDLYSQASEHQFSDADSDDEWPTFTDSQISVLCASPVPKKPASKRDEIDMRGQRDELVHGKRKSSQAFSEECGSSKTLKQNEFKLDYSRAGISGIGVVKPNTVEDSDSPQTHRTDDDEGTGCATQSEDLFDSCI